MTFGEKLKKLRTDNNLTQKDLADKVHVTFQTISKWENDENEPDFATLKELVKILNTSVEYLLGDEKEEKKSTLTPPVLKENQSLSTLNADHCERCHGSFGKEAYVIRVYNGDKYRLVPLCRDCFEIELRQAGKLMLANGEVRYPQNEKTSSEPGKFLSVIGVALTIVMWTIALVLGVFSVSHAMGFSNFNPSTLEFLIGIINTVISMIMCGIIAALKRRKAVLWVFLGLILSTIGLFIMSLLSYKDEVYY